MASTKDRQRKLARLKHERQMARRAATTRRRRQIQASVTAGLVVLALVVGGVWIFGGFDGKPASNASPQCQWSKQDPGSNTNLKDVGTPAENDLPASGHRTLTVSLNGKTVAADVDLSAVPCAAASLGFLADKGFYNGTTCHELVDGVALRCGDPSGSGTGGPAYTFFGENVPPAPSATPSASPSASASPGAATPAVYKRGMIAMIGNPPGSFGSQFLIFFKDFTPAESPTYSIIGDVTRGQDVVDAIGAAGAVDNGSGQKTKPKSAVKIDTLAVTDPDAPSATPAGANPSSTPAATPSATPSSQS